MPAPTTCTVSGVLYGAGGALLTSTKLVFERTGGLMSVGGEPVAPVFGPATPRSEITTHASTAAFSVALVPGSYRVTYQGSSASAAVVIGVPDDAETADFADLLDTQPTYTPTLVQQAGQYAAAAEAARDEAVEVADTLADLATLQGMVADAQAAEAGAETAETAAETFASGAAITAGFYATIALGRAAVADTQTFGVVAGGSDGLTRPTIYRRDSSSTQTLITGIVAPSEPEGIAARGVGYLAPPAPSDALYRVQKIELFRSVNGVTVTLPTLLTVREIARDGLNRFRLRLASFDGTSTYVSVATEDNSGGGSINVAGYTGLVWMTLLADGTSLGPADNTVIGRALIDFGSGGTFGTYTGTIAHSVGGVLPSALQLGTQFQNDTTEIVTQRAAIGLRSKYPFSDEYTGSDLLRRLVRNVLIYGADPSHDYAVSFLEVRELAGPQMRFQIQITDVTAGALACSARYLISGSESYATFTARLPSKIKMTDNLLATKTLIYGVVEFDWTATDSLFSNSLSATMAVGGLHTDTLYSDEQISDHLDRDYWHQVIRCGAAETYTTLREAVEATYSPLSGSTLIKGSPICEFSHYHNRVLIDIVDEGVFEATGLYLPDWVDIRGLGVDRTFITREDTSAEPLIEQRMTGKIFDCTLLSETAGEYCIHTDDFNRNSTGDAEQNVRLRNSYRRLRLQGAAGHNGWLFGCGLSSGHVIKFEDVVGEHLDATATEPAFGFHNSGPTISDPGIAESTKPAHVVMRGCSSPDQCGIELSTLEPSPICTLTLVDSVFNLIRIETSSGAEVLSDLAYERNAWRIGGRHSGAFLRADPVGESVLKTTAGQTPSGTAAALIFGTVDELGRGEKWVGTDATIYDLGSRLGDCSSVNKTLTIGGETHTFTADETAKNNATLLGEINASITTHPVSIVDVQLEWVPDAAPKRRVTNSTGGTIPKGRFVRFTGAGTVALCGANDRPEGWTHREILNGADGYVILTRSIATAYVEGAASSTGEWGITTAGTLDYSAGTKLGRTIGGIVEVWR